MYFIYLYVLFLSSYPIGPLDIYYGFKFSVFVWCFSVYISGYIYFLCKFLGSFPCICFVLFYVRVVDHTINTDNTSLIVLLLHVFTSYSESDPNFLTQYTIFHKTRSTYIFMFLAVLSYFLFPWIPRVINQEHHRNVISSYSACYFWFTKDKFCVVHLPICSLSVISSGNVSIKNVSL